MTFASPGWLLALLVLPAMVAAYVPARRRLGRRRAALAAQGFATTGLGPHQKWRLHLAFALFTAALGMLIVASARPIATVKTVRREATVVLAIDVSNSMAATDVKPSRLGVAKAVAEDFVRQQPAGVQIGVVAFGPSALVVQPPTFDHSAALRAISRLSLGGGTSLASGILTALDAIAGKTLVINPASLNQDNSAEVNIGYYGGSTIVLISDGEDTSRTDPVAMARLASVAGVKVQTVGVGTVAGTAVEIDGFSVATAMDPQTLQQVATVTNGAYHAAADPAGLAALAKGINLHFGVVTQRTEVTALFAIAAMALMVAGALASVLAFGRVV
ncbi:MAG TPA: VWA domain-containing protein [Acidimicrobiales bacterium]|nr:VWA domain-containing protein [Acidimicrobiales bacterium]